MNAAPPRAETDTAGATLPPGAALLAGCGEMQIINLPHRADRRDEISVQLARIGLSLTAPGVHLFPAMRPTEAAGFPSIGAHGCFLSHLAVLRAARDQGVQSVLICEDDLDFAQDFAARAPAVLQELAAQPWDIFYGFLAEELVGRSKPLSSGLGSSGLQSSGLRSLPPDLGVICAHFVAFRRPVLEALVPYLEAILAREPGDPAGGPMHVDGAYNRFRQEHPELRVLAASPSLGHQRFSTTDISVQGWKDRIPVLRTAMRWARRMRNARR